jgi:hypothetical protein
MDPEVVTKLVANVSFSCSNYYLGTIQIAKWLYIGVDKFITVLVMIWIKFILQVRFPDVEHLYISSFKKKLATNNLHVRILKKLASMVAWWFPCNFRAGFLGWTTTMTIQFCVFNTNPLESIWCSDLLSTIHYLSDHHISQVFTRLVLPQLIQDWWAPCYQFSFQSQVYTRPTPM